jgi:hypothetical protein
MSIERKEMMKKVKIFFSIFVLFLIYMDLDQFKVIDTRRVKVPSRNGKSGTNQPSKPEVTVERTSVPHVSSPSPSISPQTLTPKVPIPLPNNAPTPTVPPDYRFLLAWSYYLASQAAWLSPMLQQQQQQQQHGQLPPSLPTDPEAAAKFLQQAMQSVMEPLITPQTSINTNGDDEDDDQIENEIESETFVVVKDEANES